MPHSFDTASVNRRLGADRDAQLLNAANLRQVDAERKAQEQANEIRRFQFNLVQNRQNTINTQPQRPEPGGEIIQTGPRAFRNETPNIGQQGQGPTEAGLAALNADRAALAPASQATPFDPSKFLGTQRPEDFTDEVQRPEISQFRKGIQGALAGTPLGVITNPPSVGDISGQAGGVFGAGAEAAGLFSGAFGDIKTDATQRFRQSAGLPPISTAPVPEAADPQAQPAQAPQTALPPGQGRDPGFQDFLGRLPERQQQQTISTDPIDVQGEINGILNRISTDINALDPAVASQMFTASMQVLATQLQVQGRATEGELDRISREVVSVLNNAASQNNNIRETIVQMITSSVLQDQTQDRLLRGPAIEDNPVAAALLQRIGGLLGITQEDAASDFEVVPNQ